MNYNILILAIVVAVGIGISLTVYNTISNSQPFNEIATIPAVVISSHYNCSSWSIVWCWLTDVGPDQTFLLQNGSTITVKDVCPAFPIGTHVNLTEYHNEQYGTWFLIDNDLCS